MSKYQNDREIFYGICKFFSSNAWWRPIIEFIYSNSRSFENSLQYSTEDEHNIYIKFMDMVTDLVDNYMCSKLHISSDAFENFMAQFLTKPNEKATVIFDTLKQATNYNEFCKQMHLCNVRIENSITRALLKFSEDKSINSTDELAVFVAKQIEQDQNVEINDLVHKACVQTKKLMGINVLNSNSKPDSKVISTPTKLEHNPKDQSPINDPINKNDDISNQSKTKESKKKSEKEKSKKHKHSHHSHYHSHSKSNKSGDQNENTENNNTSETKVAADIKTKNNSINSKKIELESSSDSINENVQEDIIKDDVIKDDIKENNNKNENAEKDEVNTKDTESIDIKDDDNDENSDISELSEEEDESEDILISTLKKHQFQNKNKISLNRSFLRAPINQRNRLIASKNNSNNQKNNSKVSIVFDSP